MTMADGRRINSACQETFSRTFWVPGYEWDKVVKLKKKKVAESCLSLVGKTEKKTDFTVTSTMTDEC